MQLPRWLASASRIRKVLMGRDFYLHRDIRLNTRTLGNPYACWTFCPDLLNEKSIVYSFGVGSDVSFDTLLIGKFGLQVHAFDPTPAAVAWIEKQSLPEQFHFYPVGIAAGDGETQFFAPNAAGQGSHSLLADVYETTPVTVPVNRLQTLMNRLGHTHVDLVKLDVEGAEYEVLEDIIQNNIPVQQLLVEFHHRFKGVGIQRSLGVIKKLRVSGYKIFHVSPSGEEISFIHEKQEVNKDAAPV